MELYVLSGTPAQRQYAQDAFAFATSRYFDIAAWMQVQVDVEFVGDPIPSFHNEYAGTTMPLPRTDGLPGTRASIRIRQDLGLDYGLATADADLLFDVFVHEMGHVFTGEVIGAEGSVARQRILDAFGAGPGDWRPEPWERRVEEATAETIKDAILTPRWKWPNRTVWKIPSARWPAFLRPYFDDYRVYRDELLEQGGGTDSGIPLDVALANDPAGVDPGVIPAEWETDPNYVYYRYRDYTFGLRGISPSDWRDKPVTVTWDVSSALGPVFASVRAQVDDGFHSQWDQIALVSTSAAGSFVFPPADLPYRTFYMQWVVGYPAGQAVPQDPWPEPPYALSIAPYEIDVERQPWAWPYGMPSTVLTAAGNLGVARAADPVASPRKRTFKRATGMLARAAVRVSAPSVVPVMLVPHAGAVQRASAHQTTSTGMLAGGPPATVQRIVMA